MFLSIVTLFLLFLIWMIFLYHVFHSACLCSYLVVSTSNLQTLWSFGWVHIILSSSPAPISYERSFWPYMGGIVILFYFITQKKNAVWFSGIGLIWRKLTDETLKFLHIFYFDLHSMKLLHHVRVGWRGFW